MVGRTAAFTTATGLMAADVVVTILGNIRAARGVESGDGGGGGGGNHAMFGRRWNAPSAPDPSLVLPPAASAAVASSQKHNSKGPLRWSDLRLYAASHPYLPRRPLRRITLDGFATPPECRAACGAAVVAMEGLDSR
jgi:hypothetical protein